MDRRPESELSNLVADILRYRLRAVGQPYVDGGVSNVIMGDHGTA